jgi:hypothetical protein
VEMFTSMHTVGHKKNLEHVVQESERKQQTVQDRWSRG